MEALSHEGRRLVRCSLVASFARTPFFWQAAALVSMALVVRTYLGPEESAKNMLSSLGMAAPLVVVLAQSSLAMTPIGSSMIPVLNGMLFPFLMAITLNVLGSVLGNLTLYYVWRQGDHDLQIRTRLRRCPPWLRRFVRSDFRSLVIMRLVPYLGCNLASLIAGSHRVPLSVHILSVILGALPGSILYASVGAGLLAL